MAENAAVEISDDRERGTLTAYADGKAAGTIAYFVMEPAPGALVAVHTVVRPEHEGKGIAGALVRKFCALAAEEGCPSCPCARTRPSGRSATRTRRPRLRRSSYGKRNGSSRIIPSCSEAWVRGRPHAPLRLPQALSAVSVAGRRARSRRMYHSVPNARCWSAGDSAAIRPGAAPRTTSLRWARIAASFRGSQG